MPGNVLVQTNHHVAARFARNNKDIMEAESDDDVFSLAGSMRRADTLARTLDALPAAATLDTAADALNRPAVLNQDTCQQKTARARRGALHRRIVGWRRDRGAVRGPF
jgi:hypothetical protein